MCAANRVCACWATSTSHMKLAAGLVRGIRQNSGMSATRASAYSPHSQKEPDQGGSTTKEIYFILFLVAVVCLCFFPLDPQKSFSVKVHYQSLAGGHDQSGASGHQSLGHSKTGRLVKPQRSDIYLIVTSASKGQQFLQTDRYIRINSHPGSIAGIGPWQEGPVMSLPP